MNDAIKDHLKAQLSKAAVAIAQSADNAKKDAALRRLSVAVFGERLGDEPDVYADYDALCELKRDTLAALAPAAQGETLRQAFADDFPNTWGPRKGAPAPSAGETVLRKGCCSSISPCAWQRKDPQSICGECIAAAFPAPAASAGETRNEFEKHAKLTEHIQRMASTGHTGSMHEWSEFLGDLNAAAFPAPAASAGETVLVPREPTEAMIQAACDATFGRSAMTPEAAHNIGWRAMIAATECCEYCGPGKFTGLPGNACENCMNTGLKYPPAPAPSAGEATKRELLAALNLALLYLSANEPGDSRAVSNEFVAMSAIACGCANEQCMPIIEAALLQAAIDVAKQGEEE